MLGHSNNNNNNNLREVLDVHRLQAQALGLEESRQEERLGAAEVLRQVQAVELLVEQDRYLAKERGATRILEGSVEVLLEEEVRKTG